MKSRWKKMAITIGTVLMLGAFASASASAATPQWYVGGKALSGSSEISPTTKTVEPIKISYYYGTRLDYQITCDGVEAEPKSAITAPTTVKITDLLLSGCTAVDYLSPGDEACRLEGGELGTTALHAEMAKEGSEDKGTLSPLSGKVWSEFAFHGCVIEDWAFKISGTYPLKMPHGQTEASEQEVVFEKASGLTYQGENIYITGKFKLKLTSGANWSLH